MLRKNGRLVLSIVYDIEEWEDCSLNEKPFIKRVSRCRLASTDDDAVYFFDASSCMRGNRDWVEKAASNFVRLFERTAEDKEDEFSTATGLLQCYHAYSRSRTPGCGANSTTIERIFRLPCGASRVRTLRSILTSIQARDVRHYLSLEVRSQIR